MGISHLIKLRQILQQKELDVFMTSQPENRRYLSGFTGSAGSLIISKEINILAVDFRYIEQAKFESPNFEILHIQGDLASWLLPLISKLGIKSLGFEADNTTFSTYQQFYKVLNDNHKEINLIPTIDVIESIRGIKDSTEMTYICRATALADSAFEYIQSIISPGKSEREIAWEIEKFLRENNSEPLPFDIIVASGPNSALPHAKPSERIIMPNEPIMIDLGARVNGYCSDLSRTLCCGSDNDMFFKIYNIVLGTQLTTINTLESGMTGSQADNLARKIIVNANYGDYFGHSLGHGIGLLPHELPRVGPNSNDILVNGMVFSIEPAIYIPGWGGIRIEDTVMLENSKVHVLTRANKKINI